MRTSIKHGEFFTPRTYGVAGLRYRGFEVDRMIPAGTNQDCVTELFTQARHERSPTWELLKFHIRRSLLTLVLAIVAYYKALPPLVKRLIGLRFEQGSLKQFPTTLYSAWDRKASHVFEGNVSESHSAPKHASIILQHQIYVSPPPPAMPAAQHLANGTIIEPSNEEIEYVLESQREYVANYENHSKSESDRLVNEVTDLICWAVLAEIPVLTIYEKTGFVSNLESNRIVSSTRDKLALGSGITGVEIKVHVRSSRTVHAFNHAEFFTTTAAPTPAVGGGSDSDDENAKDYPGLEVILVQKLDVQTALTRVTESISSGNLSIETVSTDYIDQSMLKALTSTVIAPDLLILLGSKASMDGFPTYALRDALV